MDILKLAVQQLLREGKLYKNMTSNQILDKAIKIRKWLDTHPQKAKAFLGVKNINTKQAKYYYKNVV